MKLMLENADNLTEDNKRVIQLSTDIDSLCVCGKYTNDDVLNSLLTVLAWQLAQGCMQTTLQPKQIVVPITEQLIEAIKVEMVMAQAEKENKH